MGWVGRGSAASLPPAPLLPFQWPGRQRGVCVFSPFECCFEREGSCPLAAAAAGVSCRSRFFCPLEKAGDLLRGEAAIASTSTSQPFSNVQKQRETFLQTHVHIEEDGKAEVGCLMEQPLPTSLTAQKLSQKGRGGVKTTSLFLFACP